MAIFSFTKLNNLTYKINAGAIEVHRRFGPGCFESVYQECMEFELRARGLSFVSQHVVPLTYKGIELSAAFKVDLFVEGLVVVELKCVEEVKPVHEAQTLTYVKLTDAPLGLLINFNVPVLKDGIHRVINKNHQIVDTSKPVDRGQPPESGIKS